MTAAGAPDLAGAVAALARTERLLVALDFDGTLAPFVDVPEAARPLPEADRAVRALAAAPETWVALVSGRPLSNLETVSGAPVGVLLVGSHGAQLRLEDGAAAGGPTRDEERRLDALEAELDVLAGAHPGTFIERKPYGIGVHTRVLGAEATVAVRRGTFAAIASSPGPALTVRDGKDILEFAVRGETKGDAVRLLRDRFAATGTFFAGDDVTDEDGFAALVAGDVGVKVGDGASAATHRVADPGGFAAVLAGLARARTGR